MLKLRAVRLAIALCMVTTAVNLQAPLYPAYAEAGGFGVGATSIAFAFYVLGVMPILLAFSGLPDRVGRRPIVVFALLLCMAATGLTIVAPGLVTLALARFLLGVGSALTSAVAPAYMFDLFDGRDTRVVANWVTASTSLGFGLGAALTSLFLLSESSLTPPSLWLYLGAGGVALILVVTLDDTAPRYRKASMACLPSYPAGSVPYGMSIMLAWATVGLVIAIVPSVLAAHGLGNWSGFATFGICSCGVLFQPIARNMSPRGSTRLGLIILPLSYGLIAVGALQGILAAVLAGAVAASSACYGFIYLGGLSGVLEVSSEQKSRASAGFFLMAYIGFSLPVITTGTLIDMVGYSLALASFGITLAAGAFGTLWLLRAHPARVGPSPSPTPGNRATSDSA